jgi:hydroxyethylthiazole kinase-like uncharacterized protein yjeF
MTTPTQLDANWLRAHPLPAPDDDVDKNERGRVLLIGGSRSVPGGIGLSAEAALRAGAGKVRVATIESAAIALGVATPEIAVLGLPEGIDGDIDCGGGSELDGLLHRIDAIVVGPAMGGSDAAGLVLDRVLANAECNATLVVDAAALTCLTPGRIAQLHTRGQPVLLTPNEGEMAALLNCDTSDIELDRSAAVRRAARLVSAVCLLKGSTSIVATPDGDTFAYAGGGVGLATGGSGDVLTGIAGALVSRGAEPLHALLWAVWLHGEAGRRCGEQIGQVGYLARELLPHIPELLGSL